MSFGGQLSRCACGEPRGLKLVRVPLRWTLAPERAALLVRQDTRPFALIGRWAGGGALIGSEPIRVASHDEDPFAVLDDQPSLADPSTIDGDPFALPGNQPVPPHPGTGAVGGGWFGYLGYELGRRLEPVGASPPDAGSLSAFELAFHDHLLHLDREGRWWFEALWSEQRASVLRERLTELQARAATLPTPRPFATEAWRATPTSTGHGLAVAACRDRIHAGDLFQANICMRLESRLAGSPLDLFARAAGELAPERAAFMSGPWGAVASLSPELFLERRGREVRSAPIKGTRPRPSDARSAAFERDRLLASVKDRAENVMIVDLVRNDLGRVCLSGSISVDALQQARAHTGVWHLVSEVSGTLRPEVGDAGLVRAAFPPGSVSGAPKVAAMNVIAELESTRRGVYTGAIGFASPVAGLELSVAIRTFEARDDRIWLGVGGGVVADSDPVGEAAECAVKAGPLLAAIGARVASGASSPGEAWARADGFAAGEALARADGFAAGEALARAEGFAAGEALAPAEASGVTAPRPRRRGPKPVPRPDPRAGVFETLLIADGRPVALEAHLARLAHSVSVLYGRPLGACLGDELREAARGLDRARLRVDVVPRVGDLQTQIKVTELAPRRVPVRLRPTSLPGGLGAHKWIDRRLLDALGYSDAEPLLCDLDGFVLESARASVFMVDSRSTVLTPPHDGRILPGVTATRVVALARELGFEARVEPIALVRLTHASEVFVTGALGGVEPAQLITDGGGSGQPAAQGAVTAQLAAALRRVDAAARLTPA
jgi:para-aminobenzoate synthetase/4-amino-4-deoxychorismate lyase